jgi:hypothetical protein
LGRGIAASCGLIEKKYARTGGRLVVMGVRLDKTAAKQDPMCASIARIGAKALRGRSCARTVGKSEPINVRCVATVMK